MYGMNQPIHIAVIPFVFVDFALYFQSVQRHSWLMISNKFHCHLTNPKLDRNHVNVIYYVDWYLIVCNLHLCRRFEWSIRNLIGSDYFKVNKSIHHSTFTKIKMEGVLSSNKQAHLYTVITCSYHCMQFGALNIVIPWHWFSFWIRFDCESFDNVRVGNYWKWFIHLQMMKKLNENCEIHYR